MGLNTCRNNCTVHAATPFVRYMFTATMESPASWLAACCLLLVLVSGKAMDIDNVDRLEPIVRFSPAATTEADQFGFAAVLHQVQPVPSEDSANEAAAKTL